MVLLVLGALILAVPVLFTAVAVILLGYGAFQIMKEQKQQEDEQEPDDSASKSDDTL